FSGTAKDPKVTIDSENLRNNFQKNAKSALEKAIKEASDGFLKELLGEKSQVPGDAPQKDKKPTAKDIIKGLLGK
ncbi:MAG: hypothetical protein NT027_01195, partial [Proteobacteria bacterium]|nr:hypothetical protein [Pseudomonadota bacterium]